MHRFFAFSVSANCSRPQDRFRFECIFRNRASPRASPASRRPTVATFRRRPAFTTRFPNFPRFPRFRQRPRFFRRRPRFGGRFRNRRPFFTRRSRPTNPTVRARAPVQRLRDQINNPPVSRSSFPPTRQTPNRRPANIRPNFRRPRQPSFRPRNVQQTRRPSLRPRNVQQTRRPSFRRPVVITPQRRNQFATSPQPLTTQRQNNRNTPRPRNRFATTPRPRLVQTPPTRLPTQTTSRAAPATNGRALGPIRTELQGLIRLNVSYTEWELIQIIWNEIFFNLRFHFFDLWKHRLKHLVIILRSSHTISIAVATTLLICLMNTLTYYWKWSLLLKWYLS